MEKIEFKAITSQEVEKKVHDQTFHDYIQKLSRNKRNKYNEIGVKTRELAERVGIGYEMFRKILNRQKPNQPRDCIIAICAALFLSVEETNKALFYYDDLPRLDDTTGCRDFYIIQTLDGNVGRDNDNIECLGQAVDIINRTLREYGLSELRLSNKIKSKEPKIVSMSNLSAQNPRTITEISSIRYDFHRSLCEIYHPYQYKAKTIMKTVNSDNVVCYLEYMNNNEIYNSPMPNTIPKKLTSDDELYLKYSNILKDTNLRELRSCYELIFDTRNHGLRTSAKFFHDEIILFSETYNYVHPERNEFFYGEKSNGIFTFKILKKSGFMEKYLSKEDFKEYFPHKAIRNDNVLVEFTSIESVKEYCKRKFWNNSEIEWDYVKSFDKLKKRVEKLQCDLIERKEFIRNFDEYFDDEPWRLYEFYDVYEEFGCVEHTEKWPEYKEVSPLDEKYGINDGIPVGTFLGFNEYSWVEASKTEAEFNYKNQSIFLNFRDLLLAFELGVNELSEIFELKVKNPNFTNLEIKDFIK